MIVWGIVGWKNAGKTTLAERLVAHFTAAGLRVSTVKHSHHAVEGEPGTDSHRHRLAGAGQAILASPHRWALVTELHGAPEPPLGELLARLDPCDLVLVEGFKAAPHPKIEVHRPGAGQPLLAPGDPWVRAVASDGPVDAGVPVFARDDVAGIAGVIRAGS